MFVSPGKSRKLYCWLCRQPGCTRWKCNILKQYEKVPGRLLPKGNQESRYRLSQQILNVNNAVACHKRTKKDKRLVYNEFPRVIRALIIHKKYTIHNNVAYSYPEENTCLECTLIGDRGLAIPNYVKGLFSRDAVNKYVTAGRGLQLIVNNL